ncbi:MULTISPECIES: hypothetical protein [unclassified Micromonospora]|uniref:hypothetical protein n=1 Tax=unclassified Micromonospora TaxID=2617518 RepID=UPI0033203734
MTRKADASSAAHRGSTPARSASFPTHAEHHDNPAGGAAGIGSRITGSELRTPHPCTPHSADRPGNFPSSRMMCKRVVRDDW